MPKSKRNKIVHLTQVKKKGKDHKEDLLKSLEEYVVQYEFVYMFDFDQTKSDRILNLRMKLKQHGRIFAGRNSLVTLALRNIGSKSRTNYGALAKQVSGHRGLFFTNIGCDKFVALLEDESVEFREKLLGYAKLKPSDEDNDSAHGSEDDEEVHADEDMADAKRVIFKPIKRVKPKNKKKDKK